LKGITVVATASFNVTVDLSSALQQMKTANVKTVIAFIDTSYFDTMGTGILYQAAKNLAMLSSGFTIISPQISAGLTTAIGTDPVITTNAEGMIYLKIGTPQWSHRIYLLKQWGLRQGMILNANTYDTILNSIPTNSFLAYDCVLCYAYAIQAMESAGFDDFKTLDMFNYLQNVDFIGVSGNVKFAPSTLQRLGANFEIYNIQSGKATLVGKWSQEYVNFFIILTH
jgi:ABC-type branched-subunit amino acid transport system substrate-binding protein